MHFLLGAYDFALHVDANFGDAFSGSSRRQFSPLALFWFCFMSLGWPPVRSHCAEGHESARDLKRRSQSADACFVQENKNLMVNDGADVKQIHKSICTLNVFGFWSLRVITMEQFFFSYDS